MIYELYYIMSYLFIWSVHKGQLKDYAMSAVGQAPLHLTKMLSYVYAFNKYHLVMRTYNSGQLEYILSLVQDLMHYNQQNNLVGTT